MSSVKINPKCKKYSIWLIPLQTILFFTTPYDTKIFIFYVLIIVSGILIIKDKPIGRIIFITSAICELLFSGIAIWASVIMAGLGLMGGGFELIGQALLLGIPNALIFYYLCVGVVLFIGNFYVKD